MTSEVNSAASAPQELQQGENAGVPLVTIRDTFEAVLSVEAPPTVVALTGRWGEGKTFFWRDYCRNSKVAMRSGYVSLFGVRSIEEVRQRVAYAALKSGSWWNSRLISKLRLVWTKACERLWIVGSLLAWITRVIGGVLMRLPEFLESFLAPRSLSVPILEDASLFSGWIVCLDDLERISEDIRIEEILGYVNFLRDERSISVVLIYNQDKVDEDDSKFSEYQEKVIDKTIPFSPPASDLVELVFPAEFWREWADSDRDRIVERCERLKLRNVRLLFKAKQYFRALLDVINQSVTSEFMLERLTSILLFVWIKHSPSNESCWSFQDILDYHEIAFLLGAKEDNDNPRYSDMLALLEKINYQNTDELDRLLIAFVDSELIDKNRVVAIYEHLVTQKGKAELEQEITQVWRAHYHGTLRDNSVEFAAALIDVVERATSVIDLSSMDAALSMIEKLGRSSDATRLYDRFMELRSEEIDAQQFDWLMSPLRYSRFQTLREVLGQEELQDERTLSQVLDQADVGSAPLDSRNRSRLDQFTIDEWLEYLTDRDRPYITDLLRELKKDGISIIPEVARELAAMHPINQSRMESMGLVPPSEQG